MVKVVLKELLKLGNIIALRKVVQKGFVKT